MQHCFSLTTAGYRFNVCDSIMQIQPDDWSAAAGHSDMFLSLPYLLACEQSRLPGMEYRYVLAYLNEKPVAAVYFQISNLSDPGLGGVLNLHDYGFLAGSLVSRINGYLFEPSEGSTHLLSCGNLLISGDHGIASVSEAVLKVVIGCLPELFTAITDRFESGRRVVAWMVKDFAPERDTMAGPLLKDKCFRLHADPVMVMKLRPEWASLDDYIQDLSSKYRVRANASIAKLKGITIRDLDHGEIIANEPEIAMLLEQVLSKAPVKLVRAVTRYFMQLKQHFGDHYDFRGYFKGDRMVAFTSGLWDNSHYEAHYIGLDYEHNKQFNLYQNILYGFVEDAIRKAPGCNLYFGRTALEIKSTVGARPVDMGCYLKLSNPVIHTLARPFIGKTGPGTWIPRDPFRQNQP
jgi:hypothetical protein